MKSSTHCMSFLHVWVNWAVFRRLVELLVLLEGHLVAQPRQGGLSPDLAAALAPPLEPALHAVHDALGRALGGDRTGDVAGQPGDLAHALVAARAGVPAGSEA
eukprot:5415766-Pyramimonas_sp.AAC.1